MVSVYTMLWYITESIRTSKNQACFTSEKKMGWGPVIIYCIGVDQGTGDFSSL